MHKLRDAPGDAEADLRTQIERIADKGKVYVLGLGNTDRADDGAGVVVAEELKKRFPSYSFSEHDGIEGTVLDLSEKARGATVLFVDAGNIDMPPGAMKVVEKGDIKDTEITTHRVQVALMASLLEKNGLRTAIICVQPERIEFRGELSEAVSRAIGTLNRILSSIMDDLDQDDPSTTRLSKSL
jgi:hydrogenase maturation protease